MTTDSVELERRRELNRRVSDYLRFRKELAALINKHSMESESNTPDTILAQYLVDSLTAFDTATKDRHKWFGHPEPFVVE